MATPVKVGARNDVNALKDARRYHGQAVAKTETAMREVERMKEGAGRPDYGPLTSTLGDLALSLSKVTKHLEEMWTIRALAGQVADSDLAERLAAVEAELAELRVAMRDEDERLFPL